MSAFVPGCQHDVFVSYAHVDDELLPGERHPWVSYFIDKLGKGLAMKLGRPDNFDLWTDHRLGGNMPITPTILGALEKTAAIVIVLSPGYVASEWCQREKAAFLRLMAQRAHEAAGSAVFVVELDELDARPDELADLPGYRFWERDSLSTAARRLHDGGPPADVHAYAERFNDLLHALSKKLKAMTTQRPPADAVPEEAAAATSRAVYLAMPEYDTRPAHDDLRRFLEQSQIAVLPSTRYPVAPEGFQAALDADLSRCELFVQLLGDEPPVQWGAPDLPRGYAGLQIERANAAGKCILQWRDGSKRPMADITPADYRGFLESLERDATLSISPFEEFKHRVLAEMHREPEVVRPPPEAPVVFVDCDGSDDPIARELEQIVLAHDLVCIRCPRLGDPQEVQEELSTSIEECNGSIVVFGDITPPWVARQLRQFRKIRGDRPLGSTLAVYVGPPSEAPGDPNKLEQISYKLPGMRIFDGRDGLARAEIEAFLASVAHNGSGSG